MCFMYRCFGDTALIGRTYYQYKLYKYMQIFSYEEKPKAILAREVKQLQNMQVPLVKVLWQHHGRKEATWELEATMRAQYPQLFTPGNNLDDEIPLGGGGGVVTPQIIP